MGAWHGVNRKRAPSPLPGTRAACSLSVCRFVAATPVPELVEGPTTSRLREVATGILVATSRNDALNSVVVVGTSENALLVDPGWDQDELDDLASDLASLGLTPVAGIATHAHHDHLLWHPSFGDGPRWSSATTTRLAGSEHAALVASLGDGYRPEVLELFARVTPFPGPTLPWDGPRTHLLVHNAHAPGHTAIWLPDLAVLIAGDMLSDVELPLLDGAGPDVYRSGLELVAPYASRASVVIPGHGYAGTDGASRVAADRRYLAALTAGAEPEDARLTNPGMQEAHAANVAFARK